MIPYGGERGGNSEQVYIEGLVSKDDPSVATMLFDLKCFQNLPAEHTLITI